jgi:hypothetical protein
VLVGNLDGAGRRLLGLRLRAAADHLLLLRRRRLSLLRLRGRRLLLPLVLLQGG